MAVEVAIETITPELAAIYLVSNTNNRPISKRFTGLLASDLKTDKWMFTGDSIKFDNRGELIDGQHRLQAIVTSGKEMEVIVVRGLDPQAKHVIDSGRKRTAGDALRLKGIPNSNQIAAAAGRLWDLKHDMRSKFYISNTVVVDVVDRHRERGLGDSVAGSYGAVGLPVSMVGALHYACSTLIGDQEAADGFRETFRTGQPSRDGCPVHAFRERSLRHRDARADMNRWLIFNSAIHALNMLRAGKRVTKFVVPTATTVQLVGIEKTAI